jgi:hypothetical protein
MAQHNRYWSCSTFADWLRGTKKLSAGTAEEWDEWHTQATKAHPVRYWLAEEALGHIQDFVTWPIRKIYDVKYYINNRWITRSHSLTAHPRDIKPGDWQDVGNRFLPCLFNELVNFVEIETAWSHIAWSDPKDVEKYNPPFYASGWFRWRTWRCPEAGLDNLKWQSELIHNEDYCKDQPYYMKPTPQAVKAQEILALYKWWTEVYPNRPDPYDASGWTAYCELSRMSNGGKLSWGADKTPALKKASKLAHKELQKIEAQYEKEDTEMMIRLIKVRHGLWT